jgi:hypothetical protein
VSSMQASNAGPPFSAVIAFADVEKLRAVELVSALRRLYPEVQVAGWGGSGEPAQGTRGIFLSVNGVDIGIIQQHFKALPVAFDGGNQPNFYWQSAERDIAVHKSHMFVIEAAIGEMSQSISRASTVTMVVDAISGLKTPMGVMWESARNLVQADHFAKLMQDFRDGGALHVGLWVRLLAAYQPPAPAGVAGTLGLKYFGSPDIEIHARRLGYADSLSTALSYAQSRLTTGKPTWSEATTTIEDVATFRIERLANGLFGIGAVAKLTEVNPSGTDVAPSINARPFRTASAESIPAEGVAYNELMGQVVRGIRNAFYAKPKDSWIEEWIESTRRLDGFLAKAEGLRL